MSPRGGIPKVYDEATVERVRDLYERGHTQAEIAFDAGLTQKVVWNVMRRHGIKARVAAKRDQRGPLNSSWAGGNYQSMHMRVIRERGKPDRCDLCDTREPQRYEWANLTGHYDELNDYVRACVSCHRRIDNRIRKAAAQ